MTACGGPCSEKEPEAQEVALAVAPTTHPIGSRNMTFPSSPGHKAFRPQPAATGSAATVGAASLQRAAAQEGGTVGLGARGFGGKNKQAQ